MFNKELRERVKNAEDKLGLLITKISLLEKQIEETKLRVRGDRLVFCKSVFESINKPYYKIGDKVKLGVINEIQVVQIGGGDDTDCTTWEYFYFIITNDLKTERVSEKDLMLLR